MEAARRISVISEVDASHRYVYATWLVQSIGMRYLRASAGWVLSHVCCFVLAAD